MTERKRNMKVLRMGLKEKERTNMTKKMERKDGKKDKHVESSKNEIKRKGKEKYEEADKGKQNKKRQ